MITLRELEYLVALDTYRHFGKAATACFVSQPTLSSQFKKLEEQLGLTLAERHRHQIVMTTAGVELVEQARIILSATAQFKTAAKTLLDPLSGDIHVGLVPTVAPYLLSRIMTDLVTALPDIRFLLHEEQTASLLQKLDHGILDLLILPWQQKMQKFDRFNLYREPLLLATPKDYLLIKAKKPKLSDLQGKHILTLEDGHCLRDDAMSYCFAAGAEEDQRFRATSLETLRHMLVSNIGITLMPELAINVNRDDGIHYRRFASPQPQRQISAVLRPGYPRMACIREIVKVVKNAIRLRAG